MCVVAPAFSGTFAMTGVPPPSTVDLEAAAGSGALAGFAATTSTSAASVALSLPSSVCRIATSTIRASSQASSRTGFQTPQVTKRGPQSQPKL